MKKLFGIIFCLVFIFLTTGTVFAQNDHANIPEKNGDYPDPEHPGVRVRVFVHEPKGEKPQADQSPILVCNSQDPNSNAIVPPTGWHLPANWTYTLNQSNVPSNVGSGNLTTIAANAFSVWKNAVSNLQITKTAFNTSVNRAKYDGQNIIAWGRTSGSALAVTYTWYYTNTGLAVDTDTIFNLKFPWYWNSANNSCTDSNSYDAQNILTHELGHWLGLNDTYTNAYLENTMYGYGAKGEVKKDTLTNGDIQGAQAIY